MLWSEFEILPILMSLFFFLYRLISRIANRKMQVIMEETLMKNIQLEELVKTLTTPVNGQAGTQPAASDAGAPSSDGTLPAGD